MFHHLTYSVTFPTGRTFEADVDFSTGLTAITGENESGKSLHLEFLRYALFGSAALRGVASDYKTLKVDLTFSVKDELYRVERKNGAAKLFRAGETWEPIASGTNSVNQKICSIFGYGLSVFDTANAVNQGEIEALGNMKPAERKRMVDQTIGLNVIDSLIDWVGNQANLVASQAMAIEQTLVPPVEPAMPDAYEPSEALAGKVMTLRKLVAEKNEINGWLKNRLTEPTPPTPPVKPNCRSGEELRPLVDAQRKLVIEKGEIDAWLKTKPSEPVKPVCDVLESVEKLEEYEANRLRITVARAAIERQLEQFPEPEFSEEQVSRFENDLILYRLWERRQHLLKHGQTYQCPSCQYEWTSSDEQLRAEGLDKLTEEPKKPQYTESQIQAMKLALANKPRRLQLLAQLEPLKIALPDHSADLKARREYEAALPAYEKALAAYQDWTKKEQVKRARLAELQGCEDVLKDLERELDQAVLYEHALASYELLKRNYDAALAAYQDWKQKCDEKEKRLNELAGVEDDYNRALEQQSIALAYEQARRNYEKAAKAYEEGLAKVDEKRQRAEQLQKARTALKTLKGKVKAHLVPSLSRVASLLLSQMTNGARSRIEVDEEFNITVDGQALNTLSGSGKAVANLAVRIGLGQVLTNRVFSVLLADEIDAAMDADRAEATAECLRGLKQSIKQIVLVSHKRPEADQYVEL